MDIQFFSTVQNQESDILFIGYNGQEVQVSANIVSTKLRKQLEQAINTENFEGEWGSKLSFLGSDEYNQIIILGIKKDEIDNQDMLYLGGVIAKTARKKVAVSIALSEIEGKQSSGENKMALLAQGIMIGDWRFL